MASEKAQAAELESRSEAPPPYDEVKTEAGPTSPNAPTATQPFNFPSQVPCPPYSPGSLAQQPIAIPQTSPDAAAPFLDAYAPALLSRGITPEGWRAFLGTMSTFLTASGSDRALGHAADVAQTVGDVPLRLGRDTLAHAQSVARDVRDRARDGNYVGAGMGAILGGGVILPISTAVRLVGATVSLPFAAAAGLRSGKAPRERATAYAAAAEADWLSARGLSARLLDSAELAQLVHAKSAARLLEEVGPAAKAGDAAGQIGALGQYIAELQVQPPGTRLQLGARTLWLVITQRSEGGNAALNGH